MTREKFSPKTNGLFLKNPYQFSPKTNGLFLKNPYLGQNKWSFLKKPISGWPKPPLKNATQKDEASAYRIQ